MQADNSEHPGERQAGITPLPMEALRRLAARKQHKKKVRRAALKPPTADGGEGEAKEADEADEAAEADVILGDSTRVPEGLYTSLLAEAILHAHAGAADTLSKPWKDRSEMTTGERLRVLALFSSLIQCTTLVQSLPILAPGPFFDDEKLAEMFPPGRLCGYVYDATYGDLTVAFPMVNAPFAEPPIVRTAYPNETTIAAHVGLLVFSVGLQIRKGEGKDADVWRTTIKFLLAWRCDTNTFMWQMAVPNVVGYTINGELDTPDHCEIEYELTRYILSGCGTGLMREALEPVFMNPALVRDQLRPCMHFVQLRMTELMKQ